MANNAYFIHPENLLLSMVEDPSQSVRRKASDMIEKLRISDKKRKESDNFEFRRFMVPTNIDFTAKTYYTLISKYAMKKKKWTI